MNCVQEAQQWRWGRDIYSCINCKCTFVHLDSIPLFSERVAFISCRNCIRRPILCNFSRDDQLESAHDVLGFLCHTWFNGWTVMHTLNDEMHILIHKYSILTTDWLINWVCLHMNSWVTWVWLQFHYSFHCIAQVYVAMMSSRIHVHWTLCTNNILHWMF